MKSFVSIFLIVIVLINIHHISSKAIVESEQNLTEVIANNPFSAAEKRCNDKYQPKIKKAEFRLEQATAKCNATETGGRLELCLIKANNKFEKKNTKYIGKIQKCIAKGRTLGDDQNNEIETDEIETDEIETDEIETNENLDSDNNNQTDE